MVSVSTDLADDRPWPTKIARIARVVRDGLPVDQRKAFEASYRDAVGSGADLDVTPHRFLAWIFADFLPDRLGDADWSEICGICEATAGIHCTTADLSGRSRERPKNPNDAGWFVFRAIKSDRLSWSGKYAMRAACNASSRDDPPRYGRAVEDAAHAVSLASGEHLDAVYHEMADKLIQLLEESRS